LQQNTMNDMVETSWMHSLESNACLIYIFSVKCNEINHYFFSSHVVDLIHKYTNNLENHLARRTVMGKQV
jgi:hypothetical protein